MTKTTKFLLFLVSLPSLCNGQSLTKTLNEAGLYKQEVKVETDSKKREYFISKEKRKNNKQLNFSFMGDDSLSVYFNDSLVYSRWLKRSETPYISFFPRLSLKFDETKKKNEVVVVINKKREYIIFPLSEKYCMYAIYYLKGKDDDYKWAIVQGNNSPSE